MPYTTITPEIVAKCPELAERLGGTISSKELGSIQGKYLNAKVPPNKAVKPKAKAAPKKPARKPAKPRSTNKKK